MFWAKKILVAHGLQHLQGDILAAARMHDISRTHDGVCHIHGEHAAKRIPEYESFLKETFGMENPEAVSYACTIHCLSVTLDRDHPHYLVAAVLRDADALDRFRLGPHEGPDPKRIHLQRSLHFAKAAWKLAMATPSNETPLEEIERLGEELSNPAAGALQRCPDAKSIQGETPRQRRNRRLLQSQFAEDMTSNLARLENKQIIKETAILAQRLPTRERERAIQTVRKAVEFARSCQAITYFPLEGHNAFLREGITRCMWETGISWHTRYVESEKDALDAKAYNDLRLWGEKGTPITYGALIPSGEAGLHIHRELQKMYGEKFAVWKPGILEEASFCINDSQENPFCLPGDVFEEAIIRQVVAGTANQFEWAYRLSETCPPADTTSDRFNFIEIQIHRAMTPDDIL